MLPHLLVVGAGNSCDPGPAGQHCGGCCAIGEEIARHPLQPVFFNAKPGPTGTQSRKGILKQVQTRSEKEELPRKGDPQARGCL